MLDFLYWEKRPDPYLRSYIKSYWHFRRAFKPHTKQSIHPDSFRELIWVKRGTLKVNGITAPRMFIGGFSPASFTLSGDGIVETYCVRFYAWGLVPFTNEVLPSEPLFVDAADILDTKTYTTLDSIFSNSEGKALYKKLNIFFSEHLLLHQSPIDSIATVRDLLHSTKGMASVTDLAKACQLSNRQLERMIRKATGKTPQALASRIRFEYVRRRLTEEEPLKIADLASEYGFSDQSHLNKEFKRFTGLTPLEFAREYKSTYSHIHHD